MKPEELQEFVRRKVAEIYEHCDSVQILCSWNSDAQTHAFYTGAGNWYSRTGMAHEFLEKDRAQEHAFQLSQNLRQDEE